MRLSIYTDYAFRVLIYVGCSEDSVTVKQVAEAFDISKDHLGKIVNHLSNSGYLISTRGRYGGVKLAKEANQINLGEVVRELENLKIVECFDGTTNSCPINGMCSLKRILKEAQNNFLKTLGEYSLADIIKNKNLNIFCTT